MWLKVGVAFGDELVEASPPPVDNFREDLPGHEEKWWNEKRKLEVQDTASSTGVKRHWTVLLLVSGVFLAVAAAVSFLSKENLPSPQILRSNIISLVDRTKVNRTVILKTRRNGVSHQGLFEEVHGTIDVPLAEELIRRWYVAKSEALGSSHDMDRLDEVLEGNMLRQWTQRAQSVQRDGVHWEYTLQELAVGSVSVGEDGRRATIDANIKEKAELIDSGKKADAYAATYTVQYNLVMTKKGWRISAAKVFYESAWSCISDGL